MKEIMGLTYCVILLIIALLIIALLIIAQEE